MSIGYQERVLAFIDLLGWRELIKETEKNDARMLDLWQCLKLVHSLAGKIGSFKSNTPTPPPFQASVFSDLIVLSAEPEDTIALVKEVIGLAQILLSKGFPSRGAIVKGPLYHEGTIVFGQALVDAYEIESKVAKYPRIVVTNSLVKELGPYIQSDRDGIYHLDFLGQEHDAKPTLSVLRGCGIQIKKLIDRFNQRADTASEARTLDVMMKLNWLDDYQKQITELMAFAARSRLKENDYGRKGRIFS